MIDSHCHLYCEDFDADRDAVVERARAAGVSHVILPNENVASVQRLHDMHGRWPDYVSMAMGLHPEDVDMDFERQLAQLRPLFSAHRYVGVGEIGIDLYWDKTYREQQMQALHTQLLWCVELDLPFIIHCREGLDEVLQVMEHLGRPLPRGVFHSFTGTVADIDRIRRYGDFYFGVNGIVTFKKNQVRDLLPAIGLDRLLLETDSPYLAPVPHRGTRNESAYVADVAACVAAHLNLPLAEVISTIDRNATALFRL